MRNQDQDFVSISINYREFLDRYYHEAIIGLAECYPGTKTLYIDFNDLDRYDMGAANKLLKSPHSELAQMGKAVCEILDVLLADEVTGITVSVKNLPETEKVPVSQIGSDHVGKLIAVEGRITKATQRHPKLLVGAFKCQRCGHISIVPQGEGKFVEPYECDNDVCGRKGAFRFVYEESNVVDEVKIEVQELYEGLNPGQPVRDIKVIIEGCDLIDAIPAIGAHVIITGIPLVIMIATTSFSVYLYANCIEPIEPNVEFAVTAEEKQQFKDMVAGVETNILNILIQSVAPTVWTAPSKSNKRGRLLALSLLRTVHAAFTAYCSSIL